MMPILSFAEGTMTKSFESDEILLTDSFDDTEALYSVVNLMISGDDILPDVPGILYDLDGQTRTLVPISFIAKNVGAKVSWDGKKRAAILKTETKEIVLTIDSNIALVNGKEMKLPNNIPAKLMAYNGNYRTMVPVAFVTEHLGYEIAWIGATKTVSINKPEQKLQNISFDGSKKFTELRFKTTGDVTVSHYNIDGSQVGGEDRLVLDFHNTVVDMGKSGLKKKGGSYLMEIYEQDIATINISQIETNPNKARAIINLTEKKGIDVKYDSVAKEIVVQFINSVNDISAEEKYGVNTIAIKTTEKPAYNVNTRIQGKVIVDIVNSYLKFDQGTSGAFNVNAGGVKKVTYSQFEPSAEYEKDDVISRVVIELEDGIPQDYVDIEDIGDELFIYVAGNPMKGFDYVKNVKSFDRSNLDISFNFKGVYNEAFNKQKNELTLKFSKNNIILEHLDIDVDDSIVKSMRIVDEPTSEDYKVVVTLAEGSRYVAKSDGASTAKVSYEFINDNLTNSKYRNMIVVLDAGHGGHDSGANTKTSKEKSLALEATKLLKKRLESVGFRVYMTRETDTYIRLYDRANIANSLNADLFISVHINASTNAKAAGIETLYCPDGDRNNLAFAKSIQSGMLNATSAINRGVISRPNLVVIRETKMDAVLAELGFISNEAEEIKLNNTSYLKTVVEGMFNGVIDYVK